MATLTPRGQRGITLIEIFLWCVIVATAVVAVFMFGKKASVAAAVETEQRQVKDIVKTVDSIFATKPNFAPLGTNGAVYLRERAARSGLKFQTNDAGVPTLTTGLGSGALTLSSWDAVPPSGPAIPNSGYRLAYQGLGASECSKLVTATYPVAYQVSAGQDGLNDASATNLATRGQMTVSPADIAENCAAGARNATVFLYFYPARAIAGATPTTPAPAARCNPVHETQNVACPAGQIGTITQERDGTCTGSGNTLVYTVWTTTNDTCGTSVTPPSMVIPPTAPDMCTITTFSDVTACPVGQTGQVLRVRDFDSCARTYSPWVVMSNSCQAASPSTTCIPSSATQTLGCAPGEIGDIQQTRSSSCSSPTATPTWSAWETISATCHGSSVCQPQRETGPVPCAAGEYGAWSGERERFRRCVNATTQAPGWDAWSVVTPNIGCTSCPADTTETTTQWVVYTDSCPSGETGTYEWEAEQVSTRTVSYNCPAGTSSLPAPSTSAWSGWSYTGATRNVVNTCAPASCTGSSSEDQWVNATGTCPAGETGTNTWEYEQTRSRTCTSGTWGGWSGWSNTGATRNATYTCAPSTCSGNSSESQWLSGSNACPSGETGTNTWEYEQTRSRTCTSGTWGGWSGWSNTGATRSVVYTCAPSTCTGSASETQWVGASAACPSGQTGTNTWEYEQARSRTCTSGTWSGWGGWSSTGATRNVVNTCSSFDGCWPSATWTSVGPVDDVGDWGGYTMEVIAGVAYGNFDDEDAGTCGYDGRLGQWPYYEASSPYFVDNECPAAVLNAGWAARQAALNTYYGGAGMTSSSECHVGDYIETFDAYSCSGGTGYWCNWYISSQVCAPKPVSGICP